MATPNEKLADSLGRLQALQKAGRTVFRSSELSRTHLERLSGAGYLRPIVKGWYMSAQPTEQAGETSAWFASARNFISGYCDERFGEDWYVGAELSLLLHTGATSLPLQFQVHAALGKNNLLRLPAGTSLFDYQAKDFAPAGQRTVAQGLRALTLEAALVRATPNVWRTDPQTLGLALAQLRDTTHLSRILLDGGNSVVAGRLAGALGAIGRQSLAADVVQGMRAAGYVAASTNPFTAPMAAVRSGAESPYCGRIRAMWAKMRVQVLDHWAIAKQAPRGAAVYLREAEERYAADAYHSLSIEGYRVTAGLIEKVRNARWSPGQDPSDKHDRNALAARGYYEAHLKVRESLADVLAGMNAGHTLRRHLPGWYRALRAPSVQVGILKPADLAGWRAGQVFIRNSKHVPLPPDAVRDAMPLLFDLLAQEDEPAVQAILGHFVFVFVHPYMDGNGRLARYILNLMLARGGWPWTVVTLDRRAAYMEALEAASVRQDIGPFTRLIGTLVRQQSKKPPKRPGAR